MIANKSKIYAALAITIFIASCGHYEKQNPKPPLIDLGNNTKSDIGLKVEKIEISNWWKSLDDENLSKLIEIGINNNFDILVSKAKLKEARAILDINNYALGPNGAISGGASLNRLSEKGSLPIDKIPGFEKDQTLFRYSYDASWEIDASGGIKSAIDAAGAQLMALEYQNNGIRISIAAEIARAYYELNGALNEKSLAISYLENLDKSIAILKARVKHGDISQKDIEELLAKRALFASSIPSYNLRAQNAKIAIATLIGQNPEKLDYLLESPKTPKLLNFPIGQRSDLLQRRPDIRAAETMLKMRASEIKYYEAEHFPKFKINARAGWEALNPLDLFNSNSSILNMGPSIEWRIFDSGRIDGQINAAKSREEQSLIEYKKAVLIAIADSERALFDYSNSIKIIKERDEILISQNNFYKHQIMRLKQGDISKFDTLESERNIIETKLQNIKTHTYAANSMIYLLKALGGGWNDEAIK